MQQHSVIAVVGALALGSVAVPAQVSAETTSPGVWEGRTSQSAGRTVAYKGGKLRVAVGTRKKRVDYVVEKTTRCGYSRGNRSTTMTCSQLGRKQYLDKSVRVVWRTDAKKRRLAVTIAVILAKR